MFEPTTSTEHYIVRAKRLRLAVLAPKRWYGYRTGDGVTHQYNFAWIAKLIGDGLTNYAAQAFAENVAITVAFEELTESCQFLVDAVNNFRNGWSSSQPLTFA